MFSLEITADRAKEPPIEGSPQRAFQPHSPLSITKQEASNGHTGLPGYRDPPQMKGSPSHLTLLLSPIMSPNTEAGLPSTSLRQPKSQHLTKAAQAMNAYIDFLKTQ